MAIQALQPSVSIEGGISGAPETINTTPKTLDGGTAAVSATISADKTDWADYSTGGILTLTVDITNKEAVLFTAPLNVTITGIDSNLAEYAEGTIRSDTTLGANTAYDPSTGTLTFSLTDDIAANGGTATTSFGIHKAATGEVMP
ncbi:MAG: hypothetical protein LBV08_04910 [Clostridiales bacterium]|nr:hypothetical protein [Clostridiales bacterium]